MAAVLPLIGGILDVAFKIREYLVPPIKRQFNYMCCYSNNIDDLQKQVEVLEDRKEMVQRLVRAAQNNLEIIGPDVEKWLKKVDKFKDEADKLWEDTTKLPEGCIKGRCPNLKLRYLLSRRAKKMSKDAIQLQEDGKFERVSYPAYPSEMISYNDPPVEMNTAPLQSADKFTSIQPVEQPVPVESDNRFSTRKSIEERIMATLLDSDKKIISLCGMGGSGKTTMVERVGKVLKEKKLFDEVVMAVVTQQPDTRKIQKELAEMLGLRLEEGSPWIRADRLRSRILGVHRILVILDDIWGRLDLNQLGIPPGTLNCTCKVLLTSRARDICVQMGAEMIFALDVLSGEEAWILFSEEAGISDDSTLLYPIAKKVADECKGLPIALISVARALKPKSNSSWEDALVQLKRSIPRNIPEVLKDVYHPLELSYSRLESNEAQNLFLLCSLFREDSNISIEDLVRYGTGLTIFNGISNVREGRNRTSALIEMLKDRFLLVNGHKEGYVKMHDVVRDVAISIATKDKPKFLINYGNIKGEWLWRNSYDHCTHMSLFSRYESFLNGMNCPNLVFLLWEGENQKLRQPEYTFQKFKTVKVLDIHYMDIPELPYSIQQFRNLQALHFHGCKMQAISLIGELVNLEILSFKDSDFEILPTELGKLVNLRLLDLTGCENLKIIEQGAIVGLVQLEELHVAKSYAAWQVKEGKLNTRAGITELELLTNLTSLRISIANREAVSTNIHLSMKLTEYDISIRAIPETLMKYHTLTVNIPQKYERSLKKTMDLYLPTKTRLGEWIITLLKCTEDLRLNGDGSNDLVHKLDSENFQHLKQLAIQDCNTVEHLATTIDRDPPCFGVFPILETLYLYELPNIREICHGQLPARSFGELQNLHLQALTGLRHFCSGPTPNVSLSNLRSIYIYGCQNLKSLFSVSVAESLLQLEELDIGNCRVMEKVFYDEDRHDRVAASHIEFPKLNKLVLRCLHRVASFYIEIDRISFPQLMVLKMEDLPKFKGFFPAKSSSILSPDHKTCSQILFNKKVASPRIKTAILRMLDGVSKVFSHQLPTGCFHELEVLEVEACHGLNSIFSFPAAQTLTKLKILKIKNCRRLMQLVENENEARMNTKTAPFCQSKSSGMFHQLEYLEVDACNSLKTLLPLSVAQGLVKLKELRVSCCETLVEVVEIEDKLEQMSGDATPFPHLKYLKLLKLPNVRQFWCTNYDFEIPSLKDVVIDIDSPFTLKEQLAKIAKHSEQMTAYRNICKKCQEERVLHTLDTPASRTSDLTSPGTSNTTDKRTSSTYASCQSYICPHGEE